MRGAKYDSLQFYIMQQKLIDLLNPVEYLSR
jgi:hypothetical protein